MKRQRGRGRKPGGGGHHNHGGGHNSPNRSLETNGPDTKFRGTASFIHERYLQLARDAAASGDRVLSENYLQHADHYFRLVRQMQPAAPPPQPERFGSEPEFDEEGASSGAEGAEEGDAAAAAEGADQPDVEFPAGQQPPHQYERGEGEGRRRRGRRNRFRPGGGEAEGDGGEERRAEGGEGRERGEGEGRRERGEGEGRRERRERDGEQAGPEGFSNGPRPAFLRGD